MADQKPHDRLAALTGEALAHQILLVGSGFTANHALASAMTNIGGLGIDFCPRVNDAVDEALRVCPTAILIDLRERGFDPLKILESFRDSPEVGAVPIIMLASSATPELRDELFTRGITDLIVGTVSSIELVARLKTHSTAYLNVLRRNRSTTAYETLQSELRHANRMLEETRMRLQGKEDQPDDLQWQARLRGLVQIGIELNQIHDFRSLMDRILDEARSMLHADAGTIFLREGDSLHFAFFHNESLAQRTDTGDTPQITSFRLPITDRSLAGWVCLTGQPLHIPDCYAIPASAPYRFDSSFDQLLGYRTRAMLAMALKNQFGKILGVIQLINPIDPDGTHRPFFSDSDIRLLEHFASVATVALERARLNDSVINRMIRMAELRDPAETRPHVERVAGYSEVIFREWAQRRGFEGAAFERQLDRLRKSAKLHDIGKVGVSDSILKKTGPLSPDEFENVKKHAAFGAEIFVEDPNGYEEAAREVALLHHERWDGSGYPGIIEDGVLRGRRGEEIPLFARIVGIADVFEALSSSRCYKSAWPEVSVLDEIRAQAHKHFDPELVEILLNRISEIRAVRDLNPDLPKR